MSKEKPPIVPYVNTFSTPSPSIFDNSHQIPSSTMMEKGNHYLHENQIIFVNNYSSNEKYINVSKESTINEKIIAYENDILVDSDSITKNNDLNNIQLIECSQNDVKIVEKKPIEEVNNENDVKMKYCLSETLETKSKAIFYLQTTSELCDTASEHNDWDGISPEVADCYCEVLELLRNKNNGLFSDIIEESNALRLQLFQHIKVETKKKKYIHPIFNIPKNPTTSMSWLPRVSTLSNDSYTEIGSLFDLGLSNKICEKSGITIEFWIRLHFDRALFNVKKKEEITSTLSTHKEEEKEIEQSSLDNTTNINQTLISIERYENNNNNLGLGLGTMGYSSPPFDDNIPTLSPLFFNQNSFSNLIKSSNSCSNTTPLLSLPAVAIGPVLSPLLSIINNKLALTLDPLNTIILPSSSTSNTFSVREGGADIPPICQNNEEEFERIPFNEWVHIALIYKDGVVQVLKNGRVEITQSINSNSSTVLKANGEIITETEKKKQQQEVENEIRLFIPEHSKMFLGPTDINEMKRSHSRRKSPIGAEAKLKPKAVIEICEFRLWTKSLSESEIIRNLSRCISPALAVSDPFLRLSWMPTRYGGSVLSDDQNGYSDRGKGSMLFDVWEKRPLMGRHGEWVHSGEVETRWPSILPPLLVENLSSFNKSESFYVPSYEQEREEELELQQIKQAKSIRSSPEIIQHPLMNHAKVMTTELLSQVMKENKVEKTACWLPRIVRILGGQRVYLGMSDTLGLTTVNGFTIELWLRIGLDEISRIGGVGSGTVGVRRGGSSIGSEEIRSEHLILSSYVSYGSKSTESLKLMIRDCHPLMSFGDTDTELRSPHRIGNNMWTHIAFSFRGKNKRIYVDGRLVAEAGSRQLVGSCALYLGGQFSSRFDVCEMRVWSRGLSRKEVSAYKKAVISPVGYDPATMAEVQGSEENTGSISSNKRNATLDEMTSQITDDTDLRLSWFPLRYGGPCSHKLWIRQVATERMLSFILSGHSFSDRIVMKDCDSYPCPTLFWDKFRNRDVGRIECLQSLGNPLFTTRFSLQAVPCFMQSFKLLTNTNKSFSSVLAVIDEWSDAFDYSFLPAQLMDDIISYNNGNGLKSKENLVLESFVLANFDSNYSETNSHLTYSSSLDNKNTLNSELNGAVSFPDNNNNNNNNINSNSNKESLLWIPRVWFVTTSSSLPTTASSLFSLGNLSTIGLIGNHRGIPEQYLSFTVDLWVRRNSSSSTTSILNNTRPGSNNASASTPPLPDYDINCFLGTSSETLRDSYSRSGSSRSVGSSNSNNNNNRMSVKDVVYSQDEEEGLSLGLVDGRPFLSFAGHRGDQLMSSLDNITSANTATTSVLISSNAITKGRWTHLAFVFAKEGDAYIYIDGNLDCTHMVGYQSGGTKDMMQGFTCSSKDSWGMVCEMRLWNCAMSPSEVTANKLLVHHPLAVNRAVKVDHLSSSCMSQLRLCWMPLLTESTLFWDCKIHSPVGKCKEVPICTRLPYYLPPAIVNTIEEIPHINTLDNRQDTFDGVIMPSLADKGWRAAAVPIKNIEAFTTNNNHRSTTRSGGAGAGGKKKTLRSSLLQDDDAILCQMTPSKQKNI